MLLRMRRMLLMHRVLNKELNKDVIDLRRKMYQENIIKTLKVWAPLGTNFVLSPKRKSYLDI